MPTKRQKDFYREKGRVYCSSECGAAYSAKLSSARMSETNRKYASERMTRNNPMKCVSAREKMSNTLKHIGHKPCIRGGNGQPLPLAQQNILNALGSHGIKCYPEYAIPTMIKKGKGYPTCYKVDVAIPDKMIAIEVDGSSHNMLSRKLQDQKKDDLLESMGWSVYRIPNNKAMDNPRQFVESILRK